MRIFGQIGRAIKTGLQDGVDAAFDSASRTPRRAETSDRDRLIEQVKTATPAQLAKICKDLGIDLRSISGSPQDKDKQ